MRFSDTPIIARRRARCKMRMDRVRASPPSRKVLSFREGSGVSAETSRTYAERLARSSPGFAFPSDSWQDRPHLSALDGGGARTFPKGKNLSGRGAPPSFGGRQDVCYTLPADGPRRVDARGV